MPATLEMFGDWWLDQKLNALSFPLDGVNQVGPFRGLTLYRHGQFQVQLWICPPNSEIPDHSHPNVDSLQVYMSGEIWFRLNGVVMIKPEHLRTDEFGRLMRVHKWLEVPPGVSHGATIGPMGGSFMTMQHWMNGAAPVSVERDWKGEAIDADHERVLA